MMPSSGLASIRPVAELCVICGKRKAKRACPGVRGDICSICCGEGRENTVSCPFECSYLQEARVHEKKPPLSADVFPNQDIRISDRFLYENNHLLIWMAQSLLAAALELPGVVDNDVKEALEAGIRTYRTRESGLMYTTRPDNVLAGALQERLEIAARQFEEQAKQQTGMMVLRDADILGILTFLQRLEIQFNNGRPRGRAFLDYLRHYFAPNRPPEAASPLILGAS